MRNNQQQAGASAIGADGKNSTNDSSTNESKAEKKARERKRQKEKKRLAQAQRKTQQPMNDFVGGVADTDHHLYHHVINPNSKNLALQFRIYMKQIKLHCSNKNMIRLSTSLEEFTTEKKSDFITPMPSSSLYANKITDKTTGAVTLVVTDPDLKAETDTLWQNQIKMDLSEWHKYSAFSQGLYETTVGQVHDKIMASCRKDTRWAAIESAKDVVSFLELLQMICAQNRSGVTVFSDYETLFTVERATSYKQRNSVSNTEFAKEVGDMYNSVIHQNGKGAYGRNHYHKVLAKHGSDYKTYVCDTAAGQAVIDNEVREVVVSMLILKGTNHYRARDMLNEQLSLGSITGFPTTISAMVTLLDSCVRGTKNNGNHYNNNKDNNNVVALHDIDIVDDNDDSSESIESTDTIVNDQSNDVTEPTIDSVSLGTDNSFKATVLANAIAEYDNEATAVEDNFLQRVKNQQDVDDAFSDNEPDVMSCMHVVEVVCCDTEEDEEFVVIDPETDEINSIINPRLTTTDLDDDNNNSTGLTNSVVRDLTITVFEVSKLVTERKCLSKNTVPNMNNIVDYADALLCKLKDINISSTSDLRVTANDHMNLNNILHIKGHPKLHRGTIALLLSEATNTLGCSNNLERYNDLITKIGPDDAPEAADGHGIRSIIETVASSQMRHSPIRWTNKVTSKLIDCGMITPGILQKEIKAGTLNDRIDMYCGGRSILNKISIRGIKDELDFRQGRS